MTPSTNDIAPLKARLKSTWMAGDFGRVAKFQEAACAEFVDRLGLQPGDRVLDVACGTGNQSLPAARSGATVTGIDIASNLIAQARERARAEGLQIDFREGDAENIDFESDSFDVVLTMFGAMFAPRPELTARELIRVCKPGGRIAMGNWTPEGFVGRMFKAVASHLPPSPMPPPVQWGAEDIVRERLLEGTSDLRMVRRRFGMRFPFSPEEVVDFFRDYFGPVQRAFEALDESGKAALRSDLVEHWTKQNRASDGTTDVEAEYLEVVANKV